MRHQDPVYQKLREISWRRSLTAAEQEELQAWLAAHPEQQAEAEADLALDAALVALPDAPVPSNFTARVMKAIDADQAQTSRVHLNRKASWWTALLPRLALACLVVGGGALVWQQHRAQQTSLAHVAREVASARLLSDPNVLTHFDEIASLTPAAATPDEGLLSMSDDLLDLSK